LHPFCPKPTSLLALVALCIVKRLKPAWTVIEIQDAAAELSLSAERVSRIATRAVALFEPIVASLTRRGRPPQDSPSDDVEGQLALTRALLAVATSLLGEARIRGKTLRALVVGAWLRLHAEHAITQARFCNALAVPERTLRDWLKRPAPPARATQSVPDKPPKRTRPARRGRFGFGVTLPKTQIAGDTTDVKAFGVGLKLTAAQDIGGRDAALLESFVIEPEDNAEHVIEVLTAALMGLPGAQAITDQGTPYMAQATREVLEQLQAEHAPQREGHPQGKATIERAFRTVKSIAEPILNLTNRLAEAIPQLQSPDIAIHTLRLVIASLLRAYQCGARLTRESMQARAGASLEELGRCAQESREKAVARETSARQFLAHVHELYCMPGSIQSFIHLLRVYPISVLKEAEGKLRTQVHRDDIRDRLSYYCAIVRACHEQYAKDQCRLRREQQEQQQRQTQSAHHAALLDHWRAEPATWLRAGLELLAAQWHYGQLVCDGHGIGLAYLRASLSMLFCLYGPATANDLASGVWRAFQLTTALSLGTAALLEIHELFETELRAATLKHPPCNQPDAPAILASLGRNARPPPSVRLPN